MAHDSNSFVGVVHLLGGPCDTMQAYFATDHIRAHTSQNVKTTSQPPSRPLIGLPILSCPPMGRIRMLRHRIQRVQGGRDVESDAGGEEADESYGEASESDKSEGSSGSEA